MVKSCKLHGKGVEANVVPRGVWGALRVNAADSLAESTKENIGFFENSALVHKVIVYMEPFTPAYSLFYWVLESLCTAFKVERNR